MQLTATNKTPKKTRRTKEDIVRAIEALSSEKNLDWNRNNLKDKTTIPNLEIIESLLKG
tara:strand:- start:1314 stop:1490 length:177 start_codon:yes stop_codon:yes gene_type:complete